MTTPGAHSSNTCASCSAPVQEWSSWCANCGATQPGAQHPPGASHPPGAPHNPGAQYSPAPAGWEHQAPGYYPPPGQAYPYPPYGQPYPPAPYVVMSPRSTGIAVLLTFLWSGAGNLYAGQTGAGAALMVVDAIFRSLSMLFTIFIITIPLLIFTIPVLVITFIIALATSISAVEKYNNRLAYGGS